MPNFTQLSYRFGRILIKRFKPVKGLGFIRFALPIGQHLNFGPTIIFKIFNNRKKKKMA
jgi:hypothetical protein